MSFHDFTIFIIILITSACFSSCITAVPDESVPLEQLVGKNKVMVTESVGDPERINIYHNQEGLRKEQWIYFCEYFSPCALSCERYHKYPCYYLFFNGDILESFHDMR